MEQKLIETLRVHYLAKASRAEANLLNYFKNTTGVSEHPDVVGEMIKLIDELSSARGGLSVVGSLIEQPAAEGAEEQQPPAEG
mgnify:FL=1